MDFAKAMAALSERAQKLKRNLNTEGAMDTDTMSIAMGKRVHAGPAGENPISPAIGHSIRTTPSF